MQKKHASFWPQTKDKKKRKNDANYHPLWVTDAKRNIVSFLP
jgi:hypothetical protein